MKRNIVVGQSGGPTAVINASIAGVYAEAKRLGYKKVYGMIHGIEGFLQDKLVDLDSYLSDPLDIELLKRTPSAFLGSCRYKMPKIEEHPEVYQKVIDIMEEHEIDTLFYAGGNDSMDTVKMLSDYAKQTGRTQTFMGIPKTIDNDLPITDHCPGYGSAAKYIASSIKEIIRDNESFGAVKPTVVVVEIMGRHAGWLTAAAALAKGIDCTGCDAIYLPERVFDVDAFVEKVKELAKTRHSIVIAVSEGIMTADGKFVCEAGDAVLPVDAFGHKQLGGTASNLCRIIAKETGLKTRPIEFSTLQRAGSHLASLTDVDEAFCAGGVAVRAAADGRTAMMPVLVRANDEPYINWIDLHDIHDIANVEKKVPDEFITEDGCGITDAYLRYARPLIMGELNPMFVDGLPRHIVMKELMSN
ncbi:MAG: 6-phosphofructokinase [Lachnospiraceae bacterium]|nr:6-phosphofructokinase [Lachnospiraceae bacterium]MBR3366520.1 6-phosphofructokinase [Lachnospiraceae bacterium]